MITSIYAWNIIWTCVITTMSGRKQDPIWLLYDKSVLIGKKGSRAKCKCCGKEIQGLVDRMKKHTAECIPVDDTDSPAPSPMKSILICCDIW